MNKWIVDLTESRFSPNAHGFGERLLYVGRSITFILFPLKLWVAFEQKGEIE